MFDEFLDELRRRQAEAASGQPPRPVPDPQGDPVADDDSATLDDDGAALDPESTVDEDESDVEPEPITIGRGGGGGQGTGRGGPPRGPRRGRSVGGPNDGAGFSLRRQISVAIAVVVVLFVIIMVAVGLELWTDAIWYASVGYDAVFWTRLGAQVGLFVAGLVLALVVLLGNLWLAGRLAPPAEGAGAGGTVRGWLDRLNEAILESEQRSGRARESLGRRPGDGTRGPVNVTPYELPNATPIGRVVIAIVAVFVALTVGGALASNWATVLLWVNRVPFDPAGAGTVTDPVFGRDIAFFMFDLGFLRFVQVTVIGLVIASLLVAGARYLVAALDGSAIFSTPVRVHLGVLAALFLMAIAVGYQLDKFELVYSSRMPGLATGVSYTDENAQFLAYDVLTGLSALAAAFLVGGAFSRVLWPLGLTVAVWFIASIGIGRIYPEFVQRVTVTPNAPVLEAPYIQNNIAMTRLAFDLGGWDVRDYRGESPLSEAAIIEHQATFLNARLWDYRPLGDTLDQLQTVRQYYDFTDVDTDRYKLGDDTRQVMLSVRELDLSKNPSATGWVNQRVTYTHGIGVAMVPVNEVATQGQPRLIIRDLPPVSSQGAPAITEPRVYFGERESSYVVVGAQQDEFDYPVGGPDDIEQDDRWTGKTGIRLDTTLARLLYALRFRDFDLLISPQITNDSQLLFHRSLSDRLPRIAPFLLYDKDPYVVIATTGGSSMSRTPTPRPTASRTRQGINPSDLDTPGVAPTGLGERSFNYLRNSVKIVVDAYDGTMTFYANDPDDALIRAWQGVFPTLFQPMSDFPTDLRPHLRVPEEQFNVQTRVYGRYHVQNADTFYDSADLWTVPISQTSESSLPSEAYYVIMSLPEAVEPGIPPPPADDSQGSPEHDCLGRGPERWRELRPDARLSVPDRDVRLRARPDRGVHRRRSGDQCSVHALEPVRQQRDPRQPNRRPGRGLPDLPPAGLPSSH